jgi:hypothetical protein
MSRGYRPGTGHRAPYFRCKFTPEAVADAYPSIADRTQLSKETTPSGRIITVLRA